MSPHRSRSILIHQPRCTLSPMHLPSITVLAGTSGALPSVAQPSHIDHSLGRHIRGTLRSPIHRPSVSVYAGTSRTLASVSHRVYVGISGAFPIKSRASQLVRRCGVPFRTNANTTTLIVFQVYSENFPPRKNRLHKRFSNATKEKKERKYICFASSGRRMFLFFNFKRGGRGGGRVRKGQSLKDNRQKFR